MTRRSRSRSEQFAIVPEAVLYADVPDGAKVLYGILRRYANSEGECWPSVGTLAARMGVSETTVKRHRRSLTEAGLLLVQPRFNDLGQRSNLYIFPSLGAGDDAGETGEPPLTPGDTGNPHPRVTSDPHNESHLERETVSNPPTGSTPGGPAPEDEAASLLVARVLAVLIQRGTNRSAARGQALAKLPEAHRLLVEYPTAPATLLVAALLGEDARSLSLYRNPEARRASLHVVEEVPDHD